MNVLILEDEKGAAQNLLDNLAQIDQDITVLDILESVEEAVAWIESNESPDLGLFDIRLADGESFQVIEKTKIVFPVIFTTAYDEYALKAFKVNSIDYLLKPVGKDDLANALNKYRALFEKQEFTQHEQLTQLVREMSHKSIKKYKKAVLVQFRDRLVPVSTDTIAYLMLENGNVYLVTKNNERHLLDTTLNELEMELNPEEFIRANRQFIVSRGAIKAANVYFHRKLKLDLQPEYAEDVLISKPKVRSFLDWLAGN